MPLAGQGDWYGGHISPIAGYDPVTDSALIFDVWKYTDPLWVSLENLLAATRAVDPDSGEPRGFVRITRNP